MPSKSYSDLIKLCYVYIGYKDDNKDLYIEESVKKALKELEQISAFKYIYAEYSEIIPILNKVKLFLFFDEKVNLYLLFILGIFIIVYVLVNL